MSRLAQQGLCHSRGRLVHFLAKGSILTYDISSPSEPIELGDLNVPGLISLKPNNIVVSDELVAYASITPAAETDPGEIAVFNLVNNTHLDTLKGHERKVVQLLWVPNHGLVSGSQDGTVRLWSKDGSSKTLYATGRKKKDFRGNDAEDEKVSALMFADGQLFIGNDGGAVDIYNFRTKECTPLLPLWMERLPKDVPAEAIQEQKAEYDRVMARIARKKEKKAALRAKGEDTDSDNPGFWSERSKEERKKEAEVWGKGDPTNKAQLARRKGPHDNGIIAMVAVEGSAAVTTTAGEVVMCQSSSSWSSLRIFEKCFGGCIEAASFKGKTHLFAGNRGYDAEKYEVVIMALNPMQQLRRVTLEEKTSAISHLQWSDAAQALIVGQTDKGLFLIEPEAGEPQALYIAQEDRDTMDDEEILAMVPCQGQLCIRTTVGRVRRFPMIAGLKAEDELSPLKPKAQFGVKGRQRICFNRYTGLLLSVRSGYDTFKIDTADPGDSEWRRHDTFPLVDGSDEVVVAKDGDPEMGMGYPGMYKVHPVGKEDEIRSVKREEIGGLMHLKKGWGPDLVEYLEIPGDHMVVVAGELGGLVRWEQTEGGKAFTATSFEGGKLISHCDTSNRAIAVCAAADDKGGLVFVVTPSNKWVYDWSTLKLVGEFKLKGGPTQLTALPVASGTPRALLASWWQGAVSIIDLRLMAVVQQLSLGEGVVSKCLMAVESIVYIFHTPKEKEKEKEAQGTLAVWAFDDIPTTALAGAETGANKISWTPELIFGTEVDLVSSMVLLKSVGLFTAHSKVMHGISVWDPETGGLLYRLRVSDVGTLLVIRKGEGENSVMWSAVGGRVGFITWSNLTLMGTTFAEDGIPIFTLIMQGFFFAEVVSVLVSVLQVLLFAFTGQQDTPTPDIFKHKPFTWLTELEFLQGVKFDVPFVGEYVAALGCIIAFTIVFYTQEYVELKAFLGPTSCWPQFFSFLNLGCGIVAANLSLPLMATLVSSWPCRDNHMEEDIDIECLSAPHLTYIGSSVLALAVLALFCARLIRAGVDLKNIDARMNIFDFSGDKTPEISPESLIAKGSATYGLSVIASKYVLKLNKILASSLTRRTIDMLIGTTLCFLSLLTNPFVLRQQASWLQANNLQYGLDVVTWVMFLCTLLGALVAEGLLPEGQWLNWTPLMVLVLFPAALLLRPTLQRLILEGRLTPAQRQSSRQSPRFRARQTAPGYTALSREDDSEAATE